MLNFEKLRREDFLVGFNFLKDSEEFSDQACVEVVTASWTSHG